jgi:oligoendopeptidase F
MNKNSKIPTRLEVSNEYKWKLSDLYSSHELWESDFVEIKKMGTNLISYKGTLGISSENLINCLNSMVILKRLFDKVASYAHMSAHQDTANAYYQGLSDRADTLGNEVMSATSFITPEILSISDKLLNSFISKNSDLKIFKRYLNEIIRMKPHTLNASEEELLAMAGEITGAPRAIFNLINNADIKFPDIKDENGNEVEVTKGRYLSLVHSANNNVRKDAFEALYSSYEKQKNTIAATLSSNIKANIFNSKARKYSSTREYFLFGDNVSVEVYDNLIGAVNNKMPLLHRYFSLRKKLLGLEELHIYDIHAPIIKDVDLEITYEEAVRTLEKGLEILGDTYIKDLYSGLHSGWIDIYENKGKRSGAYSTGCYDSHPYVLLNHRDDIKSMFTLAHEMGHAMHRFYSKANQHYIDAQYKIFVAEVASTCNEALLMDYLLKTTKDKNQKLYLLDYYMGKFQSTVYRQTMFAEFEKIIHEKAEEGESLTSELLSSIYHELVSKYHGTEVIIDPCIDFEWMRIPHFYNSFYVYKYATGFSAATSLSKQIIEDGAPALQKYLDFLKSGGSDYPIELLKSAGVDMTTPKPIYEALAVFEGLLDEFENLLRIG